MDIQLLGPVQLRVGGQVADVGPARQRTVLAALAVDARQPVSVDTLIGRVWGEKPPDEARRGIYVYMTRLRRALSRIDPHHRRVRLDSRPGGYVLEVDADRVDLHRFGRLAGQARAAPDAYRRAGLLDEALELWRGTPLADLSGSWVARTRDLLHQQRLDTMLDWAQAYLALGRTATVIHRLRELLAAFPLVEPLAARLIEALYRDGRAAEALDCYATVRRRMVDELGTEPGSELRRLHQAMLQGDLDPPAPAPDRRHGLPADPSAFVGRAQEIRELTARVTAAAGGGHAQAVYAIDGMPGSGKTALAVHLAHRLAGRFPDGQVFVDLHGYTAGRDATDPADTLARLLSDDGVDPRHLPDGVDARSALWRERLAGRRVLLVLDNAASSAQVMPLLPRAPGCLVLVTSRRFLGDLPAEVAPVPLDVLTAEDATQMFLRLCPRANQDRAQVVELVRACGYLPLAIWLLARILGRHRTWTVADLAAETRANLVWVAAEDRTVAAAFDLSLRQLPEARQRFFRSLGRHPDHEIDAGAAADLAGVAVTEAAEHLGALHADNLLTELSYRRYRMPDLIREYARGLASADRLASRVQPRSTSVQHLAVVAG